MNTERIILHVDMDCFYAGVEMAERPELRGLPVVVGGDVEARHGIVLTASYPAKKRGVKTAMALWEARQACPDIVVVPPRYDLYMHYSQLARAMYNEYTDLVEPFGLDECWLDVTQSVGHAGGDVRLVAEELSERIRSDLGLTASVGVSWNKVFAKFASDLQKPNGLTYVTPGNYRDVVWPAKVGELLYVGTATERKLRREGIKTIGDLAHADDYAIRRLLGKMGEVVQAFARGLDNAPVRPLEPTIIDVEREIKSVGNGITTPFDVTDQATARQVVWLMGESVAQRLRTYGLTARVVGVWGRDAGTLFSRSRQVTLPRPTQLTGEICHVASNLLCADWDFVHGAALRSLGVRASGLSLATRHVQLDIFGLEEQRQRQLELDAAIDELRGRFGNHAVRRLSELSNPRLASLDPHRDNVVHPVSYFA